MSCEEPRGIGFVCSWSINSQHRISLSGADPHVLGFNRSTDRKDDFERGGAQKDMVIGDEWLPDPTQNLTPIPAALLPH